MLLIRNKNLFIIKFNYFYYICDKNEKISDFPNLELYLKEFQTTFIFTYKDLFVLKDNKYYQIINPNLP